MKSRSGKFERNHVRRRPARALQRVRLVQRGMEIAGQQVRIRRSAPSHYSQFYTEDLDSGRILQRVIGITKAGEYHVQAYRINLARATRRQ
jgi:hypothetical protein